MKETKIYICSWVLYWRSCWLWWEQIKKSSLRITCELHVAQKSHSEKTEYLLQKLFPNSHENTCDGAYFSKYDEKFVLVKLIKEDCFWHEFSSEICEIFLKLFLIRVNILWLKNDDLYIPEEYLEASQTSIRSFFDWVLNTPL